MSRKQFCIPERCRGAIFEHRGLVQNRRRHVEHFAQKFATILEIVSLGEVSGELHVVSHVECHGHVPPDTCLLPGDQDWNGVIQEARRNSNISFYFHIAQYGFGTKKNLIRDHHLAIKDFMLICCYL